MAYISTSNREELFPKNKTKWQKNNAVVFVLYLSVHMFNVRVPHK